MRASDSAHRRATRIYERPAEKSEPHAAEKLIGWIDTGMRYITIADACREHGLTRSQWDKAIMYGRIPPPSHPGPTPIRKYYTPAEVARHAVVILDRQRKGVA